MTTAQVDDVGKLTSSFEEAYVELFRCAMRIGYRISGDAALAEDLAAEALARAYSQWPRVSALPHRDAWVMRTASNLAIDAVRRRRPAATAMALLSARPNENSGIEDLVVTHLALVAALRHLPRRQRDTIVLTYFGELSDHEVSQSLGITPSSVRTHLQRGLSALRSRLDGDGAQAHAV
ncbi:MAG TPA: sigma-70 family RNA polymerase sigma factor [Mycobacteriales bacterium]|nr:sigma-70 family RNA polymerase sigma factor [Mycobacteriales bacterium]